MTTAAASRLKRKGGGESIVQSSRGVEYTIHTKSVLSVCDRMQGVLEELPSIRSTDG